MRSFHKTEHDEAHGRDGEAETFEELSPDWKMKDKGEGVHGFRAIQVWIEEG